MKNCRTRKGTSFPSNDRGRLSSISEAVGYIPQGSPRGALGSSGYQPGSFAEKTEFEAARRNMKEFESGVC
jgi:hypothetical protein